MKPGRWPRQSLSVLRRSPVSSLAGHWPENFLQRFRPRCRALSEAQAASSLPFSASVWPNSTLPRCAPARVFAWMPLVPLHRHRARMTQDSGADHPPCAEEKILVRVFNASAAHENGDTTVAKQTKFQMPTAQLLAVPVILSGQFQWLARWRLDKRSQLVRDIDSAIAASLGNLPN